MNKLQIFGVIGDVFDGITAKEVASAIETMSGPLLVQINSPGGIADDGVAIYNLLREYSGYVTTRVLGIAASAASVVAMAGDKIEMAKGARMMIHNAWGMAIGDHRDMVAYSNRLKLLSSNVAEIYAERSGKTAADMQAAMDAETWYRAEDAIAMGLADSQGGDGEGIPADASQVLAMMGARNIPADLGSADPEKVDAWKREIAIRKMKTIAKAKNLVDN